MKKVTAAFMIICLSILVSVAYAFSFDDVLKFFGVKTGMATNVGGSCTYDVECDSGNCAGDLDLANSACCPASECWHNAGSQCLANGYVTNSPHNGAFGNGYYVCVNGEWILNNNQSCTANTQCASNNCVPDIDLGGNGCCPANKCWYKPAKWCLDNGYQTNQPHAGRFGNAKYTCINSNWFLSDNQTCSGDTQCFSTNCARNAYSNVSVCCPVNQCWFGAVERCLENGYTTNTPRDGFYFICVNGDWISVPDKSCEDTEPTPRTDVRGTVTITQGYWIYGSVEVLYRANITKGCAVDPLRYCPDTYITRADAAIFIARAINYTGRYQTPTRMGHEYFTDVPAGSLYDEAVGKLKELNITLGCTPTTFCPNDYVPRSTIAILIARTMSVAGFGAAPLRPGSYYFTDVPAGSIYDWDVGKLKEAGVTQGCTETQFCPNAYTTRAQAAVFLQRAINLTRFDNPTPTFTDVPRNVTSTTQDTCRNASVLAEAVCTGANVRSFDIPCPNGCSDGVCLNATTTNVTCTDSDNGENYYVRGSTTGLMTFNGSRGVYTMTDFCQATAGWVQEYFCMGSGEVAATGYNCPTGCTNGACNPLYPNATVCTNNSQCVSNTCSRDIDNTNSACCPVNECWHNLGSQCIVNGYVSNSVHNGPEGTGYYKCTDGVWRLITVNTTCTQMGYNCTSPIRGCGHYAQLNYSCGDNVMVCCERIPSCGDGVCFTHPMPGYGETPESCPQDCNAPDLAPTDVSFSPASPAAGEVVQITTSFENRGNRNVTGDIQLIINFGDGASNTATTSGSMTSYVWNHTYAGAGNYVVKVIVNVANDSNPANNIMNRTVYVFSRNISCQDSDGGINYTVKGTVRTTQKATETYWAYAEIEAFYKANLTQGCALSPLRYCPEESITRAQLAVWFVRARNLAPYDKETPTFADVPKTHWAYKEIEAVHRAGIMLDCANDPFRFCPDSSIQRDQIAIFMTRAFNLTPYDKETPSFVDVPKEHLMYKEIEALYRAGITIGCTTNPLNYCPNDDVTRSQAAVFFVRALGLNISNPPTMPSFADVPKEAWGNETYYTDRCVVERPGLIAIVKLKEYYCENNAMKYLNITCPGKCSDGICIDTRPDLLVNSIIISPENPREDNIVKINVTLSCTNCGSRLSSAVRLHIDSTLIRDIPVFVTNRSTTISTTWTAVRGWHNVTAWVDPYNTINETDETNNKVVLRFYVASTLVPEDLLQRLNNLENQLNTTKFLASALADYYNRTGNTNKYHCYAALADMIQNAINMIEALKTKITNNINNPDLSNLISADLAGLNNYLRSVAAKANLCMTYTIRVVQRT